MSETNTNQPADLPSVSVAVSTYNRRDSLSRLLKALANQTFDPLRFEVIVVSDGSTDGTVEMVASLAASYPVPLRLVEIEHQGIAAARNAGVAAAGGDLVAFTDDDCIPYPDWLAKMVSFLEAHPELEGVGGRNHLLNRQSLLMDYAENYNFLTGPGFWRGEVSFIPACNALYRREKILAVGGFDESQKPTGEDVALSFAIKAKGGKLGYEPEAGLDLTHATDFSSFLRSNFRYGKGETIRYRDQGMAIRFLRLLWRSLRLSFWLIIPIEWIRLMGREQITPSRKFVFPIIECLRETALLAGQWVQFLGEIPKSLS